MLILSRKMGESIRVGDNVTVTVLGVARGQVKVGIEAPRDLTVHREEIYQRIQEEKARAEPLPEHPGITASRQKA